jgi:hypothetical protein
MQQEAEGLRLFAGQARPAFSRLRLTFVFEQFFGRPCNELRALARSAVGE